MKMLKLIIKSVILVHIVSGCATVPLTDRRQLTLISNQQMESLSRQEYRKVIQESNLSHDMDQIKIIEKVGKKIAIAVDDFLTEKNVKNTYEWEFNLIHNDELANAWCMPGGKIAFYTGILKYTQNEAGIAAVMGHEVAHALARHSNERMSQAMVANFGTSMVARSMADKPIKTQKTFRTAIGLGTQFGIILPFSRLQESEADRIGLILMAKAGYDPQHAVEFWRRMKASKKRVTPEFLSTHPSDTRRIQDIESHLIEAYFHYDPFKKD